MREAGTLSRSLARRPSPVREFDDACVIDALNEERVVVEFVAFDDAFDFVSPGLGIEHRRKARCERLRGDGKLRGFHPVGGAVMPVEPAMRRAHLKRRIGPRAFEVVRAEKAAREPAEEMHPIVGSEGITDLAHDDTRMKQRRATG